MAAPDPIRGGTAKPGLCPKTEAAPHPILTVEGARYRQFAPPGGVFYKHTKQALAQ